MFDLEQSITEWRRQMLADGIQTPVPLEELESHLREEIEQLKKSGMDERTAFENAAHQTGQPRSLKSEFNKIETFFMETIFKCVAVLLIGIAAQLPGSLQLRDQLVMSDKWLGLWLLGFILQMRAISSLWRMARPGATRVKFEKFEMSFSQLVKAGMGGGVLLTGVALAIPAAMQAGHEGLVKFDALCWLVFGFALMLMGALVIFCPYKKRTA